jgi:tRNA pseudouridine38-40 synthase
VGDPFPQGGRGDVEAHPRSQRYRLTLEYDGTSFYGWQMQINRRTVQGVLEQAIGRLYGSDLRVYAAGRTDTGVHSLGQVVHFDAPPKYTSDVLARALNFHLPEDIRIRSAEPVSDDFHARFSARWRWYRYRIFSERRAINRMYGWFPRRILDGSMLRRTADLLVGEFDFRAFCAARTDVSNHRCRVFAAKWRKHGDEWHFHIVADRFLRHMVRRLVGTMTDVDRGRFSLADFERFLREGRKVDDLYAAPPQGLCLMRVGYGDFPYAEPNGEKMHAFPFSSDL